MRSPIQLTCTLISSWRSYRDSTTKPCILAVTSLNFIVQKIHWLFCTLHYYKDILIIFGRIIKYKMPTPTRLKVTSRGFLRFSNTMISSIRGIRTVAISVSCFESSSTGFRAFRVTTPCTPATVN